MSEYRQILPKPGFGQLCNGCGLCCAEEPCLLAMELGFVDAPCGILEDDGDGRFACGLTTNPYQYLSRPQSEKWVAIDNVGKEECLVDLEKKSLIEYFKNRLAIGCGCDSDPDRDKKNE